MLLSIAYFPPVSWFAAIAEGFTLSPDRIEPSVVYLEACETYRKQSWRNRCQYYSPLGVDTLTVPVVHENGTYQLPIREIKVDYSTPWLQRTMRSIDTAYRSSAYFDYYRDDLYEILSRKQETLWELDLDIIRFFLSKTGVAADIRFTEDYCRSGEVTEVQMPDLRDVIHPKRDDTVLRDLGMEKPYFQVFAQKYGFKSNLSIMDLLFNEGPDSVLYLKKI